MKYKWHLGERLTWTKLFERHLQTIGNRILNTQCSAFFNMRRLPNAIQTLKLAPWKNSQMPGKKNICWRNQACVNIPDLYQLVPILMCLGDTGDSGLIPGLGDPLEKEMATHSSILAWRIPGIEEPGGVQSMGSQKVKHDWGTNTFTFK